MVDHSPFIIPSKSAEVGQEGKEDELEELVLEEMVSIEMGQKGETEREAVEDEIVVVLSSPRSEGSIHSEIEVALISSSDEGGSDDEPSGSDMALSGDKM
jgi:hypothetical protein